MMTKDDESPQEVFFVWRTVSIYCCNKTHTEQFTSFKVLKALSELMSDKDNVTHNDNKIPINE